MKTILKMNPSNKIFQAFAVLLASFVSLAFVSARADESAAIPSAINGGGADNHGSAAGSGPELASKKKAANENRRKALLKKIKALQKRIVRLSRSGKDPRALVRQLAKLQKQFMRL